MRLLILLLMCLSMLGCDSGNDLAVPEGLTTIEMREIVTEANPLWDPVERAVTDVRLLSGRRIAEDRYSFDAEYEIQSIVTHREMEASELAQIGAVMREQGRVAEWQAMEARRKTADAYIQSRMAGIKEGERHWFRDTFVLVRVNGSWTPEDWAARHAAAAGGR